MNKSLSLFHTYLQPPSFFYNTLLDGALSFFFEGRGGATSGVSLPINGVLSDPPVTNINKQGRH